MKTKIVVGIAVLVVVVFAWVARTRGMHVEVRNVGNVDIDDVVVTVTGIRHELGSVDAGDTETASLESKGAAGIVAVTWTVDGREAYARLECYFEPSGYNGTITFVIDGVAARETTADIDIGFF